MIENNFKNITLINYSDKNYKKSQRLNSKTGLKYGGMSKVISYSPSDIEQDFYLSNKKILDNKRGNGYWLWKPYFIKKTLEQIDWNDYLFYCDSGSYFIDSVSHLKEIDQDIVPFELIHIEKMYTKRDIFIIMDCDQPKYTDTSQRLASFILWKKTPFTMKFIDEWLFYSKDERLITDNDNIMRKSNYKIFKDHRHDQSIFSLLTKKHEIPAYRDPSQFGNDFKEIYATSHYPQIIELHRKKDSGIKQKLKYLVRLCKTLLKNILH
ncbi:hypothetical protein P0082_09820 [Candidatus Haliotispira prima]|uniref:Uncharacterized protein n=1 Tax=Candidatus Haliotispira prima TaxID=3034016 RepID=A0ABY8MFY6_9SPIO|nr:hypothetical protein P0082_09820 [Candidatus Haliotispira prima]